MNVVLYVLDALRADHLSCYGYERETSPTIDTLASDGVVFEQCFSPSTWTRPVAASLLTGSYPPTHDTQTRNDRFNPHVAPLAEQFRSAGYDTVGVTSMGNVSTSVGFDRGFDHFFDRYTDEEVIAKRRTSTVTDEELKQEQVEEVALPRAADLTDAFSSWLDDRTSDDPFFGLFWAIDTHIPYDPPEEYRTFADSEYEGPATGEREDLKNVESDRDLEQLRALYDGEIAYTDACIGDLIERLREAGEFEDTLFVVVGDHGDAFGEHGRLTHGHAPYDELIHVPCVMRTPEGTHLRDDSLCSLVDVYPTLLDYADVMSDPPDGVQGSSLASALSGDPVSEPAHEHVFSKTDSYDMQNTFYGVRSTDWKYIEIEEPDRGGRTLLQLVRYVFEKGIVFDILRNPRYYLDRYRYSETEFLYDLATDPGETENILEDRPEQAERLRTLLREWETECTALGKRLEGGQTTGSIDEGTREQLRQLGYSE